MTTFALVHGANASGAIWAGVALELSRRGHRVVAPDLPCEDRDATFADYAAVVRAAVAGGSHPADVPAAPAHAYDPAASARADVPAAAAHPDDAAAPPCAGLADRADPTRDAVLVGHSLGGCTIAELPAARHVYLAAMIPQAGRTLRDVLRDEPMLDPRMAHAFETRDGLTSFTRDAAEELFLHDVRPEKHDGAFAALRGQSVAPWFAPSNAVAGVPATYVVCAEDRVVSPAWGREAAPRLLGADVVELPGGHAPQLTRPRELAALLEALA